MILPSPVPPLSFAFFLLVCITPSRSQQPHSIPCDNEAGRSWRTPENGQGRSAICSCLDNFRPLSASTRQTPLGKPPTLTCAVLELVSCTAAHLSHVAVSPSRNEVGSDRRASVLRRIQLAPLPLSPALPSPYTNTSSQNDSLIRSRTQVRCSRFLIGTA